MKLHRHKWQYLSKEFSTIETAKSYHGYASMGGSRESTTQEVTLIKRFCKKCGEINVQTVLGKLVTADLQKMGYYND